MVNRYLINRIGQAALTLVSVITLTFVMIRFLPGGPIDYLRARIMQSRGGGGAGASSVNIQELNSLAQKYMNIKVGEPLHIQYINYVTRILQGEFGKSFWFGRDVGAIIADAAPWTIFLLTTAIILTFAIGIVLGAFMAYYEGGKMDSLGTTASMFFNSVPYFVAALLFVYVFAIQLNWFPAARGAAPQYVPGFTIKYIGSVIYHAILPISSLVITGIGGIALGMRGNAIKEIGEEYIRVANLRGISGRRIAIWYVGRNAVLPLYTQFLISIGFMFGGTVVLEQIFGYPGLGSYLITAINARDYPLMMGIFIVIMVAVVAAILFADLTYSKVDPRVAQEGSREAY